MPVQLSALHLYPVKSCRGLSVTSATIDAFGLVGDRRFMVVNAADGQFITQRTHPRMALIETTLSADVLILSSPNQGEVSVPRFTGGTITPRKVTVWSHAAIADDCDDAAAEWLTRFLGQPVRLVRMGAAFQRPIKSPRASADDAVSFADGYPVLMISEGSLAHLNDRLIAQQQATLPMNRFRPNLVVSGCEPFAEDGWLRLTINDVMLRHAGPCARCAVTTVDQLTAERGLEPLPTLAAYRRDATDSTKINFGVNFINETKRGTLRVGDRVIVMP